MSYLDYYTYLVIGLCSTIRSAAPGEFDALWTITRAATSTPYSSCKIKLTDIGIDAAITAQAGTTYSINGGTATGDAGTISDGDILVAYLTSSASYNDAVSGGVVIATINCAFTIETMVEPVAAMSEQDWDRTADWDRSAQW